MPQDILDLKKKLTFCADNEWQFLGEFPSLMLPKNSRLPDPIPDVVQSHHTVIEIHPACGYEASKSNEDNTLH